jgi:hypothetical protein
MNRASCKIIAMIVLAFGLSCVPKPKIEPAPAEVAIPIPYDLKAAAFNGKATLSWKIDRPARFVSGGYSIYLAESKSDTGKLYNPIPYPGDIDGDASKETFEITDLVNGRIYKTWVRILTADGVLGPSSETLNFVSQEVGQLTIYFDMLHDSSGYSFAKHKYTKARDYDNDFYLYEKNGAHISSPSLYNSGLRESDFELLPPRPPKEFRFATRKFKTTSMAIQKTNKYSIRTADNGLALIKVEKYIGTGNLKRAIIRYGYLPPSSAAKYDTLSVDIYDRLDSNNDNTGIDNRE